MANRRWNTRDKQILMENLGRKTIVEISLMLGRSEQAVYLYCFRNKIPLRPTVEKNIIRKMFQLHFGSEKFFSPTREFYENTGISQKEFQKLWMGYKRPSSEILSKIAKAINFSRQETFKLIDFMQLELFQ